MISGRRSPYRQRGRMSESLSTAGNDDGQRRDDEVERPRLELPREREQEGGSERRRARSLQRQSGPVSVRGASGKKTEVVAGETDGHLPSYAEATGTKLRASSAVPKARPHSFASSDRSLGLQTQHLMPPNASMAGASLTRPRSAQDYYDHAMTFSPDRDNYQSYLRDPRLNDSFLHDPYSRGPSLFGPREPTYLIQGAGRPMMHMEDRDVRVDARRRSGARYREDVYDEPSHGKIGRGGRQGLLGALLGAAVQSGMNSHSPRKERAVSIEPPMNRRMAV